MTSSIWRDDRRYRSKRQDVLLLRIPGTASISNRHQDGNAAAAGVLEWRLLTCRQSDNRSPNEAAVPRQCHSKQSHQCPGATVSSVLPGGDGPDESIVQLHGASAFARR